MTSPVLCPRCNYPIAANQFAAAQLTRCGDCETQLLVRAFPALLRPAQQGIVGERITDAGQAACFYHPGKVAHVPCDACGRFICTLCEVELHGEHLCPSCIDAGRRKGTLTTLESRRVLWDNIAIAMAIFPFLFCFWPAVIGAPAAIFLAVFGWRKPRSVVPRRTSLRFSFALLFAGLTLVGLAGMIYVMIESAKGNNPFGAFNTDQ